MTPLKVLQDRAIAEAEAAGLELFLGVPDAWYEPQPNYGCANGHVSRIYIKHDGGGPTHRCPRCYELVAILPHGYTDDSLCAALAAIDSELQKGKAIDA